jgi:hypothetical protein
MTLLRYFNSLRELGGTRRIVEDEVNTRLKAYGNRLRVGEGEGPFANRTIAYEVVELTSRVSTGKVAEAKDRLALPFDASGRVAVALAKDLRRRHPGDQPRRPGPGEARAGRHPVQHPPPARSVARRAVRHVPPLFLPERRSNQRHALLAPGSRPRPGRHPGRAGPPGACVLDAGQGGDRDPPPAPSGPNSSGRPGHDRRALPAHR